MKENSITWNGAKSECCIRLESKGRIRRRVLELAEEYPDEVKVAHDGKKYLEATFPSKWLKITPPRKLNLTEEQRIAIGERFSKRNRVPEQAD